jgi:diacylglycerol kinase (ATP)
VSSPFGPMRLIVNPRSGNGAVGKNLPALREQLDERGLAYDVVETAGPKHATEAAQAALDEGIRYLVAVGGDGTVQEVVNGMFDGTTPRADDAVLGVAAYGSGCDFVRTFGLDRKPQVIAEHLSSDATMPIDVGVASFRDDAGAVQLRLWVNIAEAGWGADVVAYAERMPRWIGRIRYLLAAYAAIRAAKRQETTVTLANTATTVPLVNLVVANGQFFGGGMWVAPRALPDDGRFNVQLFSGPRSQVFTLTTKIYRGDHIPHPDIREQHSPTVELAPPERMRVEADGEVLGWTPAEFSLLPKALRLKI